MKVLELFAGSRSIGKIAEERGHKVFSVDIKDFEGIDLVIDIEDLEINDLPWIPDMIWDGRPCTTYSVAAIQHHRNNQIPKTDFAIKCDRMNIKLNKMYKELGCIFYIENPRGMLRKMDFMQEIERTSVTYCSYGDTRMKPTDIWSNNLRSLFNPDGWEGKPMCHNFKYDDFGNVLNKHCHHDVAPRGSTVRELKKQGIDIDAGGTQFGLKNNYERSKMPHELCEEIIIATEKKFI